MGESSTERVPIYSPEKSNRSSTISTTDLVQGRIESPLFASSQPPKHTHPVNVADPATESSNSTSWTAILDSINALKDLLTEDHDIQPGLVAAEEPVPDQTDILFGSYKRTEKQGIIAAIPPRAISDRLVSTCFNSVEIAPVILHCPTFLEEYENFWEKPDETPIMWIGLLFGIICLGALNSNPEEIPSETNSQSRLDSARQVQKYHQKAAQSLILGDYTKDAAYTIETLILYIQFEHLQEDAAQIKSWVLLGTILRLAFRMEYNREVSYISHVALFHTEMRRRIWAVVFTMDTLISGCLGLPRMIRSLQCNVEEPRNLLDSDISRNMTKLPVSRPEDVQTPVRYIVAKYKVAAALAEILDLDTQSQRLSYAEILRLDGSLHSAYDSIPQWLITRPMSKSIMDSPTVIAQRITVMLIYHRAKVTLHRPYLLQGKTEARYMYSRTACVEAALGLLSIQKILNQELQVGGRLQNEKRLFTPMVESDFMLASTILCVDVNQTLMESHAGGSRDYPTPKALREDVVKALDGAYHIRLASIDYSQEGNHVVHVLRSTLDRVQRMKEVGVTSSTALPVSDPTTNQTIDSHTSLITDSSASWSPRAVNARLVASNPMFVPNFSEKKSEPSSGSGHIFLEMVSLYLQQYHAYYSALENLWCNVNTHELTKFLPG